MGFLKKNSHFLLASYVMFDLFVLTSSYIFSLLIVHGSNFLLFAALDSVIYSFVIIAVLFFVLQKFEYSGRYRVKSLYDVVKGIVKFQFVLLTIFYIFIIFRVYSFSNEFVFTYFIITSAVFMTERVSLKLFFTILRKRGFNYKNYLIVGAGELGLYMFNIISDSNEFGIRILGFLDDRFEELKSNSSYPDKVKRLIIGSTDRLENILRQRNIDNVIIALPMLIEEKIISIANVCEKYGVKAELIPDYYKITSKTPSVRMIKGYPLIGIRNVPLENTFNRLIKRMFDIMVSFTALTLLMPIFIFIVIGIKLTSKGPVFFTQKRTGFKQKEFNIVKFRTMIVNTDADTVKATKDDPRKTVFGDFLRRTNLDELPQLINILKGEMSLVGPRPHMIKQTEEYYNIYDKYLVRHWVKPGLTGWAQVNGWRGDTDIGMRVKYDIEYIENWTFFLDIKIILLTAFGKKVRRNAY